jgi:predicted TIM-barrel fold metal-dependent hydrolase
VNDLMNDADNHYYEADDCFTRHIEPEFKERTFWIDRSEPGRPGRMYCGKERCAFYSVGVGDSIGPPGIMKDFLRGLDDAGGSPSLSPMNALEVPAFVDRSARLAKMDTQRVDKTLMLPTMGVGVETQLVLPQHRDVLYPSIRAFNRWIEDDWGYDDGRIYGAAMISLADLDQGLVELERLIKAGARFVCLMAGPIEGRSPGDPHFDPFWARCQDAGINVVFHIGSTSVERAYNVPWGLRPSPPSHRHSLMEYALSFTDRPVVDTLTALISDNMFGRFPNVRVLSVEYGATWVAPMIRKLDHIARLFSKDMWRFGAPPGTPSEMFKQNVSVAPFFEDDVVALSNLIGSSQVLAGSDYPHPEGLAEPQEFADELAGLSDHDQQLIMRDNFEGLVA